MMRDPVSTSGTETTSGLAPSAARRSPPERGSSRRDLTVAAAERSRGLKGVEPMRCQLGRLGGTTSQLPIAGPGTWRAAAAESAGTFVLVLLAAGGPTIAATGKGHIDRVALAIAPGLIVTALIYALGAISGAHFNPVVTVTFAGRGDFPWQWVPGYLAAQLAGALLACVLLRVMFGVVGHLGATLPGPRATDAQAFAMELLLTGVLVLMILGTALGAGNVGHNSAIAVGGFIAAAGLFAGTVSGASMNPTPSIAPAVVSGRLTDVWIYVGAPVLGALLAALLVRVLGGRGTRSERDAALGEQAR